jgi:glycosyltransferase involved in cell wall biosynthesis
MMQYVASADLGVVIYRNINLNNYLCAPTKLYEFVMVGVPVVVSDFPELAAFLDEFPAGRTFDPEQPVSIAAAVNAFFRADEVEHLRCKQALERARRIFTWEQEGQKLLHIFRRPAEMSA